MGHQGSNPGQSWVSCVQGKCATTVLLILPVKVLFYLGGGHTRQCPEVTPGSALKKSLLAETGEPYEKPGIELVRHTAVLSLQPLLPSFLREFSYNRIPEPLWIISLWGWWLIVLQGQTWFGANKNNSLATTKVCGLLQSHGTKQFYMIFLVL